ncbi:hypothetical protein QFC20_001292 [Naganishia adeliensis]|uniref:Uncharacterized protein n=1 Tax=Naganishia adeliensis TaxID=92952 RepID=A0ACC2WUX3_9TREE|nr:hypothetical protein QFC20_001292 [Naganishia adeliensis]
MSSHTLVSLFSFKGILIHARARTGKGNTSHFNLVNCVAMLRRLVIPLPRAPSAPTYWTAQVNVIDELLRARASAAARRELGASSAARFTTIAQRSRATKDVGASTSSYHQVLFKPTSASPILGILARPQASASRFASQRRAFHSSPPQRLPAPAVILAAGALLKASFY